MIGMASLQSLCRTCARNSTTLVPLFLPCEETDGKPSPAAMLSACTKMAINPDDALPKSVCEICLNRIVDAFRFGSDALRAQETLMRLSTLSADTISGTLKTLKPVRSATATTEKRPIRILPKIGKGRPEMAPPRRCTVCRLDFADAASLTDHNLRVHFPTQSRGGYSCNVCHKVYKEKYILTRHSKKAHPHETKIPSPADVQNTPVIQNLEEKIECRLCQRQFTDDKNLSSHMKSHFANVCEYCNRGFFKEQSLKSHTAEHATKKNPYTCAFCQKNFLKKKALVKHQHEIHNTIGEIFFCGHCSSVHFVDVGELQKHLRSNHDDKLIAKLENAMTDISEIVADSTAHLPLLVDGDKNEDDKKFTITYYIEEATSNVPDGEIDSHSIIPMESSLSLEDIEVLNNKINCDLEKKKITTAESFEFSKPIDDALNSKNSINYILMDITSNENTVDDIDLNSIFKSSDIVDNLENSVAEKNETPPQDNPSSKFTMSVVKPNMSKKRSYLEKQSNSGVECKVCQKKFARLFNLQKHMISHTDEPLVCLGCKFSATSLKSLSEHIRRCQMLRKNGNMVCGTCGKILTTPAGFRYHLKSHAGIRQHSCGQCEKLFSSTSNLIAHTKKVHSKERLYACKLCPRRFANLNHLSKHMTSTHLFRRDHVCHSCGKKFFQRSHLMQHMWIHTGIKPHRCLHCPNEYTSKNSLNKHLSKNHLSEQKKTSDVADDKDNNQQSTRTLSIVDFSGEGDFNLGEGNDLDQFEVVFVVQDGDPIQ